MEEKLRPRGGSRRLRLGLVALGAALALPAMAAPGDELVQKDRTLQALASVHPGLMLSRLTPAERAATQSTLGSLALVEAGQCAQFFRSSVAFVHAGDGQAESYWWNPFVDEGLALDWSKGTDGWTLSSAQWVSGQTLRGDKPGRAAWTEASSPARALTRLAGKTDAAIQSGALVKATADDTAPCARAVVAALSAGQGDPLRLATTHNIAAGAATDTPLNATETRLAGELATLPPAARATMSAQLQIGRDAPILVWQSPAEPGRLVFVHYPSTDAISPSGVESVSLTQ